MKRAILAVFAAAIALCITGCGRSVADPEVQRQAAAVGADLARYDAAEAHHQVELADQRIQVAKTAEERDEARAEKQAALAQETAARREAERQKALADAATERERQQEDRAERLKDRGYATLCGVLAAMLGVLAMRLPLLRTPLALASACLVAGGAAFETAAWLVGYRWLIPAGLGGGGLLWAVWHLIQHHDVLHALAQHAEVDAKALAGKSAALVDQIKAHHAWHLPAFLRRAKALGATWTVGQPASVTIGSGSTLGAGTSLAPFVDASHAGEIEIGARAPEAPQG